MSNLNCHDHLVFLILATISTVTLWYRGHLYVQTMFNGAQQSHTHFLYRFKFYLRHVGSLQWLNSILFYFPSLKQFIMITRIGLRSSELKIKLERNFTSAEEIYISNKHGHKQNNLFLSFLPVFFREWTASSKFVSFEYLPSPPLLHTAITGEVTYEEKKKPIGKWKLDHSLGSSFIATRDFDVR